MLRTRRVKLIKVLLIIIAIVFLAVVLYISSKSASVEFTKFNAISNDGAIYIGWQLSKELKNTTVNVSVYDSDKLVDTITVPSYENCTVFKEGRYGQLYHIKAQIMDNENAVLYEQSADALFLEYDKLPDLPLFEINTTTGEDPTYEEAEKPDASLWGESIVNNRYLPGNLKFTDGSSIKKYDNIKIKIRGNTSAIGGDKKPYRIRFETAVSFFDGEEEFTQTDWVLLKTGNSLNTYVGNCVSEFCGMEWNMHAQFVNVILNGDWKGCYYLVPAVCYDAAGGLVDSDGYIFEYDAYWWKPETVYFKLENHKYEMGYTFKYPEITSENDRRLITLKKYMQEFENFVVTGDESYTEYADVDSFAEYILVRDILGEGDGGGANYNFYKKNSVTSKVKMGPVWDFDGCFTTENLWSVTHTSNIFYFPYLFSSELFNDVYTDKWGDISNTLLADISEKLEKLDDSQGRAISESWKLDNERWGYDNDFAYQKQKMIEWFNSRIPWINNRLKVSAEDMKVSEYNVIEGSILSGVDFQNTTGANTYINGWAFRTDKDYSGETGILVGDSIYLANKTTRQDIKELYALDTDQAGFSIVLKNADEYKVCIIDMDAKTVYL